LSAGFRGRRRFITFDGRVGCGSLSSVHLPPGKGIRCLFELVQSAVSLISFLFFQLGD